MKTTQRGALAVAASAALLFAGTAMPVQAADYVAHLYPMNPVAAPATTSGEARFSERGGKLTIDVRVEGASPDTEHWQHFHGFKDGKQATCPTQAADVNRDGFIDLIETGPASGTTMVPFIGDPASMDVAHGTYPKSNSKGAYHYRETVSVNDLQAAFGKAFPGQQLDLDHRVVYIHGVPASAGLPPSVASLGPIPSHVTLCIACGVIERVR